MRKLLLSCLAALAIGSVANAKSYKIGPSSVSGMDFGSINEVMTYVSTGDTLFLDKAYKAYEEQNVTKSVVIVGTGFDTSTSTVAMVTTLNLKADGIHVNSLYCTNVNFYNKDCRVYRCFIGTQAKLMAETNPGCNALHSCYITGLVSGKSETTPATYDIQNSIVYRPNDSYCIRYVIDSNIIHNVLVNNSYYSDEYTIKSCQSTIITDNIIISGNSNTISNYDVSSMNTIHHNVMSGFKNTTNYPTNKTGYSLSSVCTCSGTTLSGNYFKLKDGSPAKGYASDGGDCGIFGGLYTYADFGRPIYVPYFTNISVPAQSTNGTLPISLTVKVQNE